MIKLPAIHIGKLSMLLSILVWLALLFVDLVRIFGIINALDSGISNEITWILEILFFFTVYFFYTDSIEKNKQKDFLDLIWRAASTGIFATVAALLTELFYFSLGESKLATEPFLRNFFYHVNFALTTIFLISTALLWKHLILYQKTKQVVKQWQAFEFSLLVAMFFVFFNKNNLDYSFIFGMVILLIISAILSGNLKWIPFLILIFTGFLFRRFLAYSNVEVYQVNLTDNLFLVALFGFIFLYALFSFLVTLFNLPTSSVFEQKLTEAINFQRLSQSIKPDENEEQVLDILMDSCMSASYADGAWLELQTEKNKDEVRQVRFLDKKIQEELSEKIHQLSSLKKSNDLENDQEAQSFRLDHPRYESALIVPLEVNHSKIGKMILIKEVRDGFNKEMTGIVRTFARQACIAVENHRLLNQAIQNERYQEELKIAQRVQKSLLPTKLDHPESFQICAFSNAADEVGGDYYDTFKLDEDRYVLIIGDVSGKGTSAAFHMSQMKGIFHSLIQLNLSPAEFMIRANSALSRCLEKNHFITASIFLINIRDQKILHARAGHVPTLFYQNQSNKSEFMLFDGLGLGILRNRKYENHVQEKEFYYSSGDILVLITDGIIEAKNKKGQQFGFGRIQSLVEIHKDKTPIEIQNQLIDTLHAFVGGNGMIDDDYSLMVVKFLPKDLQNPN
jgi:phosphoserine phosphatase RsbU/P